MTTTTTVIPTVREEVQRGAELLDERMPGWDEKINLATLHLNWCDRCVLGQLYEWYDTGCDVLGFTAHGMDSDAYGFSLRGLDQDWDKLTEEWRDLIASRR